MTQTIMIFMILAQMTVPTSSEPWEGYTDRFGYEVPGLVTNDTWMTPLPTHTKGKIVFFGPYAMDATAQYRGIDYEKESCIGGISLMSPYNIRDKAWVNVKNKWYGPFCVVDCARRGDMYSIVANRGEVAEVNFEFAQQLGMVGENIGGDYEVYSWFMDAEVLVNVSPEEYFSEGSINPDPIYYPDYFIDTLEFASGYEPRVILTNEGLWKEYGEDKYWLKTSPDESINHYLETFKGESECQDITDEIKIPTRLLKQLKSVGSSGLIPQMRVMDSQMGSRSN